MPSLNGRLQNVQPQTHLNASEASPYQPARSPGTRVRQGNPAAGSRGGSSSGESRTTHSPGAPALPFYLMAVAEKLRRE